jgi:hypothetical protein
MSPIKLVKLAAAILLGGQVLLALVGMAAFMTQTVPSQVDGYGVSPLAAIGTDQSTR